MYGGINLQALPSPNRFSNLLQDKAGIELHQHRIEKTGRPWTIEGRVPGSSAALLDNGIVVFQELRFLRILERDEHHRVAEFKSGGDIGDGLIVVARDLPTGDEIAGLPVFAGAAGHDADHHGTHVALTLPYLLGNIEL